MRPGRWNERHTPSMVALCLVYVVGMVAAIAWSTTFERPYPGAGEGSCRVEVIR